MPLDPGFPTLLVIAQNGTMVREIHGTAPSKIGWRQAIVRDLLGRSATP